jgi:oligopeptide/dipeptide ABC transporter ATP-binding protein
VTPILEVRDLETTFGTRQGPARAVRGVSFAIERGETLGLVGESGCGKSVTALSIIGLLPPAARITAGSVQLDGVELTTASSRALRRVRGRRIAMVFQDSMTSLNPLIRAGRQITESLEQHQGLDRARARRRAVELLEEVGVPDPVQRLDQYPHQLSGGLRQRVAVAIALACDPDILIADEPTTALDVTIQAQLLELLRSEQERRGMALILITHDLGVVARMSDRLCVMYAGRIVEQGAVAHVFAAPRHPYTIGLLASVPQLHGELAARLPSIGGQPPAIHDLPLGCPFHPRCPYAFGQCAEVDPPLETREQPGHLAACWADVRQPA